MSDWPQWQHVRVTRGGGVSEVLLHTEGGPLRWNMTVGLELTECLRRLGDDQDTRVIVLSGAGDAFCASLHVGSFVEAGWERIWDLEKALLTTIMELNTMVVAVLNGPVAIHSDIPLLADIVLACPEAEISDRYHFTKNVVPGDGVQLVWGSLFGPSRAGYHLLTGAPFSADDAHALGAIHEIRPREELRARARALAENLAERPAELLTYTKAALRIGERRNFRSDLSHSLALQGLAVHAARASAAREEQKG